MFHRSIGSTGKQRISAVACVLVLMLTMAFPAAAAPSRPDPFGTDFGDLPGNYPTLLPNGARHLTEPWVMLGACVDHELDGQPSSTATGDDTTPGVGGVPAIGQAPCTDDEDGITRVAGAGGSGWTNGAVASGNGGAVQVTIYGITGLEACLGAFFDFNRDPVTGNLQTVVLRDSSGNPATQPLTIGTYTFYFDIPSNTFDPSGPTQQPLYARFRIASALGSPGDRCGGSPAFIPTGEAQDGEVEDYQWNFGPNAVTLSGMTASSAATPLALPLGLVTLLGVLVGGIVLARRPN